MKEWRKRCDMLQIQDSLLLFANALTSSVLVCSCFTVSFQVVLLAVPSLFRWLADLVVRSLLCWLVGTRNKRNNAEKLRCLFNFEENSSPGAVND